MTATHNFFPYEHRGPGIAWNFRFSRSVQELDAFGLALADRDHVWTPKQRTAYEKRVRELTATGGGVPVYGSRKK